MAFKLQQMSDQCIFMKRLKFKTIMKKILGFHYRTKGARKTHISVPCQEDANYEVLPQSISEGR